jgi:hypothetical protein
MNAWRKKLCGSPLILELLKPAQIAASRGDFDLFRFFRSRLFRDQSSTPASFGPAADHGSFTILGKMRTPT